MTSLYTPVFKKQIASPFSALSSLQPGATELNAALIRILKQGMHKEDLRTFSALLEHGATYTIEAFSALNQAWTMSTDMSASAKATRRDYFYYLMSNQENLNTVSPAFEDIKKDKAVKSIGLEDLVAGWKFTIKRVELNEQFFELALNGTPETLTSFLKTFAKKIYLNAKSGYDGATALILAALNPNQECLKILTALKLKPEIKTLNNLSVEDFILMQTPPEIRPIEKRTLRSYVSQKHLRELLLTEPTKSIWNLDMIQDFDQSPSKVEVRTLSNGEKGLFAAQFIPKYALVAEFVGAIIYTDRLDKTSEAYAFTSILGKTSDTFCISPRRDFPETQSGFMANDGFPNVINETFGIRKFYMAIRNIQIGEEIQANYGHFHPVKSLPHYTLSLENIDACQTYLDTVKGISGLIQIIKPLLENPHHDIKQFIIAME